MRAEQPDDLSKIAARANARFWPLPSFVALLRHNPSIAFDDDDQFIHDSRADDCGGRSFAVDHATTIPWMKFDGYSYAGNKARASPRHAATEQCNELMKPLLRRSIATP
jgi:hypothetical protein